MVYEHTTTHTPAGIVVEVVVLQICLNTVRKVYHRDRELEKLVADLVGLDPVIDWRTD